MPLVAGFDSSTQATKLEVRDADTGTLVASGRVPHPPTSPPRSEQDPQVWWEALNSAYDQAGRPRVDAVAVAAQQHGMVALDAAGTVLRPAKLWNDTESAPQAAALRERWSRREWAQRTGSVPVASFTITKLAWLAETEPEAYARTARVCLPHDWLTWRLSGELVTDRGDASGTGYWSPAEGTWLPAALDLVDDGRDWLAALPEIRAPAAAAGTGRLGARAVVAAGTGDNMAAALGLALRPGDVAVSVGTSGTVYGVSDTATADASGAVAGFADATGRYLPLVCTLNAGKVTSAVGRLLGCDTGELDRLALASPAGAGGVVLLPYFDGERTPDRPDATGLMSGLRGDVSRAQFARAAFEGVVCSLLDGLDALTAAGVGTGGRLFLIGGGARSPAYRRILAHLAGRPVHVPTAPEHVAAGACVQAAAVLAGISPDIVASAWDVGAGSEVEPEEAPGTSRHAVRAAYHHLRDTT